MSTGVFQGVCDVRTAWLCVPILLGYLVWDVQHWSLQVEPDLGAEIKLWESSCQLIFPRAGNSLAFQNPALRTHTAQVHAYPDLITKTQ